MLVPILYRKGDLYVVFLCSHVSCAVENTRWMANELVGDSAYRLDVDIVEKQASFSTLKEALAFVKAEM